MSDDLQIEGKQRFKELGGRGVPLIVMGSKVMRGFSPERFEAMASKQRCFSSTTSDASLHARVEREKLTRILGGERPAAKARDPFLVCRVSSMAQNSIALAGKLAQPPKFNENAEGQCATGNRDDLCR